MADVAVMGAGPAGYALAAACARSGLETVLIDPTPDRQWRNTYSLWRDELPGLPRDAIAAAPRHTLAAGRSVIALEREYLVVDNAGLRRWLTDDRVRVVTGTVTGVTHGPTGCLAVLDDGRRVAAAVAVDARGVRLGTGAEQTAFGLVLPATESIKIAPPDTAVFMDWRDAPERDPSFLYVIPLGDDRVLVEETSLARSPGLPIATLSTRLRARLAAAGVDTAVQLGQERVRIPLDIPLPRPGPTVAFGARAALVHPSTGFSVATSLGLAPRVASAIADGLRTGPRAAVRAARRELWPPGAVAVHALRRHALRALRRLPPDEVPAFFDVFFDLPESRQRAFTSARDTPVAVAAAMAALFPGTSWRLRLALMR